MTCTHHWTVTSECPMCLRDEIQRSPERAAAAIYALAIMERDRTIAALQAEIRKLKPYCAVCGRTEPCETDQVACTFDPSPRALYEDNLRLRAEVERLRRANEGAEAALKAQRAVIDSLRPDADRYRWLRSAETGKAVNCVAPGAFPAWLNGPELDAAIDAAREDGK